VERHGLALCQGDHVVSAQPPRFARIVARLVSPSEDRELLLADLDERFQAVVRSKGAGEARRWYWSQALRGMLARVRPDFELLSRRSWEGTMGDFRQSIRSLTRRPLYSLGVVGTLSIGLASAAAVSSVAWHVWLAPMPFPDGRRSPRWQAFRKASSTGGEKGGRHG